MPDTPLKTPSATSGTAIIGATFEPGDFYYIHFQDAPAKTWTVAECVQLGPLERGFHTIRGLIKADNSNLLVVGKVAGPVWAMR